MHKQGYNSDIRSLLKGNIKLTRAMLRIAMRTERWNSENRIHLRLTELHHLRHTHTLANLLDN